MYAGKPKFVSPADKLQSVNVTEGDEVRLPCRVSAEPVANIVWMRNGEPLDRKSGLTCFLLLVSFGILPQCEQIFSVRFRLSVKLVLLPVTLSCIDNRRRFSYLKN